MTLNRKDSLALGPPPWIIGHRGAAGSALENTLDAIRAGISQGADMIEVDVQMTADEIPVLFHDWDLRRLAGRSEIIERTSAHQLLEIPLPNPFGENSLRIATLEEALAVLPLDPPLNLEIKRRFHEPQILASTLARIFERHHHLLVSSFDWPLLVEIRRLVPELPVAPLGRWKANELLGTAEVLDAFSVHAHRELVPEITGSPLAAGRPFLAYTVNDAAEARRLFDLGAAGVFTNFPGRLRADLVDE